MTRNIDLLIKTLRHIQANPKDWAQERWGNACSTAYCFAGHAAILSGAEVPREATPADRRETSFLWNIQPDGKLDPWSWDFSRDTVAPGSKFVSDYAAEKLGLERHESEWLFAPETTLEYLEAAVHALVTGGEIHPETGNVSSADGRTVYTREELEEW